MRMISRRSTGLGMLVVVAATAQLTGAPFRKGAVPPVQAKNGYAPFSLTVDSIMRGPKLVGYPPTAPRWSDDSSRLYLESRRPEHEDAGTSRVGRGRSRPRKHAGEPRPSAA